MALCAQRESCIRFAHCPGPVNHPQKLLIKGDHDLQPESIFRQITTAFGLFKVRKLKRRMKASIPFL
jgi:hypothetical protein